MFLRTTEFLWQEGHTAHATDEEAETEVTKMLGVYRRFAEEWMALPVITGIMTESEKFAGAKYTSCIEAMMQDGKALQPGTSHHLGQNFAKAFDVTFQTETGKRQHVFTTSWGVSTRLIGTLIMAHSDDRGLVIPPKLASIEAVVVPISRKQKQLAQLLDAISTARSHWDGHFTYHIDDRVGISPGYKFADWELKGIPVRIEIGPRELQNNQVILARRDKSRGEDGHKTLIPIDKLAESIPKLLSEIQDNLFAKAKRFRNQHTFEVQSYEDFRLRIGQNPGFYWTFFSDDSNAEASIQKNTGIILRCIPFEGQGNTR